MGRRIHLCKPGVEVVKSLGGFVYLTEMPRQKKSDHEIIDESDAAKLRLLEAAETSIASVGATQLAWFFEFAQAIGWFEQLDAA
jgi:hypothetical protein